MRLRGGRDESSMDLESRTASQIKNEMDYLGDEDTTESVPLDWRIERPDHLRSYRRTSSRDPRQPRQPIFSDRDVDKTLRFVCYILEKIEDAESAHVM
ncbi:hypothetical protein OESDEN_23393 [Oesophagostomum dentatum]|uniref:Uncharacterized protein n=1 Tax=Oesophagostomum dentatum TaxID=61180 RepID=A0A0B1S0H8_OESDE|nr:hypothetical protein OESDEN_23393 [Oesophagostomum dentatum]